MKRIGIALAHPRGATKRQDEYEVLQGDHGTRYARYVGYREQRSDGEAQVGLPLAGPNAAHLQPIMDFVPNHYATIRFFDPPLAAEYVLIEREEPEWHAAWNGLEAWLAGRSDTVATDPETGERWQYMGTVNLPGCGWKHQFRHRRWPVTGERTYVDINVSEGFPPADRIRRTT